MAKSKAISTLCFFGFLATSCLAQIPSAYQPPFFGRYYAKSQPIIVPGAVAVPPPPPVLAAPAVCVTPPCVAFAPPPPPPPPPVSLESFSNRTSNFGHYWHVKHGGEKGGEIAWERAMAYNEKKTLVFLLAVMLNVLAFKILSPVFEPS
ncbi:hypothetical protein WR25_14857 [Diploscapter pachys]|uniref:Uncharacterized protein n=1 Tax=Diploscapter pachys TaxID=2018661 RepID=A0A2A2KNE9_9BILA|nr:hypothetical protein WR25_14857 [Diploscapter pachys]